MSDRELGRIVASRMGHDEGSDVANSLHLDPERLHAHVIARETGHDVFDQALPGGPWTGECKHGCGSRYVTRWELEQHESECLAGLKQVIHDGHEPVHDQLLKLEAQRREFCPDTTRKLAEEALARMEQHLPPSAAERKGMPVATGFIDYFPDAVAAVATLSRIGNDQHNPGSPLHWDRSKSGDESDALMRHFLDRGSFDTDGVRHSVKVAWRAMALLQKEIEAAKAKMEPVFK